MTSGRYCTTRLMEPEDLPAVLANERAAYDFPWTRGIFLDCLKNGYFCLVAEENHRVVGHALMLIGAGEAHLLNLCVNPECQRSGFARVMLQDCIDTARRQGCEQMFLEVRPSNHAALALYHEFGFNELGRRPAYYDAPGGREDALMLALML